MDLVVQEKNKNMQHNTILITGGAGFIGSHLVKYMVEKYPNYKIHVMDSLTSMSNLDNLDSIKDKITLHRVDISLARFVDRIYEIYQFDGVINLAVDAGVDNPIEDSHIFLQTNILGTHTLIKNAVKYNSRFLQVSTDEVYGGLEYNDGRTFYEFTPFKPNTPYAASKASADFLVDSFVDTYGLNASVTHSSNNYGSNQQEEKLIPKTIKCLKENSQIPIYGSGDNIRDWVHVEDHIQALDVVYHTGKIGEHYNIGGGNEYSNLELVRIICRNYDTLKGVVPGTSSRLISFVNDKIGHDLRYSINYDKLYTKLRWKPTMNFSLGLVETIKSYM